VVRYGHVESTEKYREWLMRGSIVISTAKQENFGISVIEAVRYGCIPLLPDRLAYPEILPKAFHSDFLYKSQEDLIEKLFVIITHYPRYQAKRNNLSEAMGSFAWENLIDDYDEALENLVRQAGD
jgi:glycosyltransferase involved in cell wall biosynthesis